MTEDNNEDKKKKDNKDDKDPSRDPNYGRPTGPEGFGIDDIRKIFGDIFGEDGFGLGDQGGFDFFEVRGGDGFPPRDGFFPVDQETRPQKKEIPNGTVLEKTEYKHTLRDRGEFYNMLLEVPSHLKEEDISIAYEKPNLSVKGLEYNTDIDLGEYDVSEIKKESYNNGMLLLRLDKKTVLRG